MNCAYHIENGATVNCSGCGKPLCAACDHRIKGFPYCQNCIVDGVELLQTRNKNNYEPVVRKQSSPFVAAFLSFLCPGLGAAYNGQTTKGLVQFLLFIALFQLANVSRGTPFFVLAFFGLWAFAAFDSWRTAQLIRAGISPESAEDILLSRISGNSRMWGIVLLVIGATFVLQTFFDFRGLLTTLVLPLLLIGIGIHLLVSQLSKKQTLHEFGNSEQNNYLNGQNSSGISQESAKDGDFKRGNRRSSW